MKGETTREAREVTTLFELLSNPRRRTILQAFHEHGDDIEDIHELVDLVAAAEANTPIEQPTDKQKKRIYISLYQTHMPKLADAGVIHYDPDTGTVDPTPRMAQFATYMGWSDYSRIRKPVAYLVLAVLCGLFFTGSVLNVGVLGSLPELVTGIIIIAAFLALTIAYSITEPDTRLTGSTNGQRNP